MATDITMPKLSDTMTEGKLVSWKKSVGERVERGDIIAEVETDKATMELEAFASGVLVEQRVKTGEMVDVGTVIGVIGEPGEAAKPAEEKPKEKPEEEKPEEEKPEEEKPEEEKPEEEKPEEEKREKEKPEEEKPPAAEAGEVPEQVMELPEVEREEIEKASPVVRRLAREQGVDLGLVKGSGPDGRILMEDLERHLAERKREGARPAPEAAAGEEPLSRMRRAIARVTSESWQTIPHFYETVEIHMEEAGEIVRELKGSGREVGFNDLVVKATAMAMEKYPKLNASFRGDRIVVHGDVNIGIAVAVEEGLQVPVLGGCQGLSLGEIALRTLRLVDRARSGKITQEEISGGTFSISNLGMYGIEEFAAVILPPQAAILAVGSVAERPVVRDGHVVAAKTMRVTLSCDHRIVDGAYAARFLGELKRVLENPVLMLV